jgi:hypothetical protein
MTDLSPAAQAVYSAILKIWPAQINEIAAAALRALAKQAGYDNYHVDGDHGLAVVNVRDILAIAAELEGGNE